jgi:hypothetical protein
MALLKALRNGGGAVRPGSRRMLHGRLLAGAEPQHCAAGGGEREQQHQ